MTETKQTTPTAPAALARARQIQSKITSLCPIRDADALEGLWDELSVAVRDAQAIARELKLIKMAVHDTVRDRVTKFRKTIQLIDHDSVSVSDIAKAKEMDREIAPGISLHAVEVPSEEFVPDSPLYYIRNTGEWGVRIGGTLVSGGIGEIKRGGRGNDHSHIPCSCNRHGCPKWHIAAGRPRDWLQSHWIYTDRSLHSSNAQMRHFGSRRTLRGDILGARDSEIQTRAKQTAHDLLVYLCAEHIRTRSGV